MRETTAADNSDMKEQESPQGCNFCRAIPSRSFFGDSQGVTIITEVQVALNGAE